MLSKNTTETSELLPEKSDSPPAQWKDGSGFWSLMMQRVSFGVAALGLAYLLWLLYALLFLPFPFLYQP